MESHSSPPRDPIKHVVLLMMENHSFDQMLGSLKEIRPDLDGIDPGAAHFNLDNQGGKIYQQPTTETQMSLDPYHNTPDVLDQLKEGNSGFVKNFISHYPKSSEQDRQNIMGYYPRGFLPALHALAEDFTVCDAWHASVPGPTWANRFFALSGTSSGRVKMLEQASDLKDAPEIFYQRQDTLFDRLNEAKKSWRVYYHDTPVSIVFSHQREPENLRNYHPIDRFFQDIQGSADQFPEFTFIEPKYFGQDQNDDHPPHNIMKAQALIAQVYNAIRSNPAIWASTLLVVSYDEHGGFYDHVEPPRAIPPDHHAEEYTFTQLGVRVPALLISPWAKRGVEHTLFDHTSLLKYLIDKWDLGPLGERTRHANSIAVALNFEVEPRNDCIKYIYVSNGSQVPVNAELEKWDSNANQQTFHTFANYLHQTRSSSEIPPRLSACSKIQECVGHLLVKVGMWCQSNSQRYRQDYLTYSSGIVERMIEPHRGAPTLFAGQSTAATSSLLVQMPSLSLKINEDGKDEEDEKQTSALAYS